MGGYTISNAMRFFLLSVSIVLWTGIWLTGFGTIHWLLYLLGAFLLFAVVTGICPGMIISNRLFGDRPG